MKKQKFLVSFEYEFDNSHNINEKPLTNEQVTEKISTFLKAISGSCKKITLVEKTKMEHQVLEEHLNKKYDKKQLISNTARVINKEHPSNPDKSTR